MNKYASLFDDGPELVFDERELVLGVTGTQRGANEVQLATFAYILTSLLERPPTRLLHGGCVGFDEQAHNIVLETFPKCEIEIYPGHVEDKRAVFGPAPGENVCVINGNVCIHSPQMCDIRNAIIARRARVLIAAPAQSHEILRSGTWQTARMFGGPNRAQRITDRPMYIIAPDGIFTTYRDDFFTEMNAQVRAQEGLQL